MYFRKIPRKTRLRCTSSIKCCAAFLLSVLAVFPAAVRAEASPAPLGMSTHAGRAAGGSVDPHLMNETLHLRFHQDGPVINIRGTITDSATRMPLVGVSVRVRGTETGTITDAGGHFSVDASSDAVLVVSYLGYVGKEIPVRGRTFLTVMLGSSVSSLNQVVVVGYGTQKKSDLSSSIATVDADQLRSLSVLPNVASALEGTTAGVSATPSSGAPGAGINIKVRGASTFGNNAPLVIIDGAPGDLNDINPEDIASMQVLKDAAAAAIYGSRAANGVVIVTTKKGHSGEVQIELKASYGVQSPRKFIPVTNAKQYAVIDNALHNTAGIAPFPDLANPESQGEGTDWQDVFYNSAPMSSTYLGISGGNENSTFRISGSFDKQKGIAVTSAYQKAMLRYSGQQKKGAFTFGENIGYTEYKSRDIVDWIVQGLLVAQPIIPLYDSANEGGYGGVPSYIPVQGYNAYGLSQLTHNTSSNNNVNADVYMNVKFLKHFTYRLNAGYKTWYGYNYAYTPTYYMSTNVRNEYASLGESRTRTNHWLIENTLTYNREVPIGAFNIMAGYTAEQDRSRSLGGAVKGFPNNNVQVINATTGYSVGASGSAQQWDLVSVLGRLLYNYHEKYYLTANIRRDGSSKFGPVNRYGVFPSASAAWRVSREKFFQSLTPVVSNLKLRGSYGVLGNEPGSNYSYIPQLGYATKLGYMFGNSFLSGAAIGGFTNPAVQWERTRDLDIGVDMDFLDHFSLTMDYYMDKTDNLLLNVPVPPSTGGGSPLVNIGKLENHGMEFTLNYHSPVYGKGFHYEVTGNLSTVSNKVLELGYGGEVIYGSSPTRATTEPVTAAKVGYPIGAFFVKQALGLFQSQQEVEDWTDKKGELLQPAAQPGDVRYKDVSGDGIINNEDVVYAGSPFPTFSYGLNLSATYGHFDLTVFFQGTYGNKMFDANTWRLNQGSSDYNFSTDLLHAWSASSPHTDVPRLSFNDPNHNEDPSSRFLYDASYLRLRTLQIGYSLPSALLSRYGISSVRIYASANNLLTFTRYPGYDPSYTSNGLLNRGLDQSIYPVARIISAGLYLHF